MNSHTNHNIMIINTAIEAIINISLKLNPIDLFNFFKSYPEFKYLLNDPYYLWLLAEKHLFPLLLI